MINHSGKEFFLMCIYYIYIAESLRCTTEINTTWLTFIKGMSGGFPGGSGVKNPLASAGDTGLIPDQGRSHKLWSN